MASGVVDQTLDDVIGLGPPGAAIGVDRYGVGINALDAHDGGWRAVAARQHRGAGHGRNEGAEIREIGAEIGGGFDLEREEVEIAVEREARAGDVVAAMRVGEKGFAALAGPFHRAPELLRRVQHQPLLGIEKQLHAETAAHVGRHHAECGSPAA